MKNNPILFVGAGPGDPDLITVAGQKALAAADVVIYAGSLVNPAILNWSQPGIELMDSSSLDLAAITDRLIQAWEAGRRVVRLHTGDPSVYGAIHEQLVILRERGIPTKIIPGVTAALAAAATLGLEYTLPEITQTLIITRAAGRTPVPVGEELANLARSRSSLAIYLSAGQGSAVATALAGAYGQESPLALIYRATWPEARVIWTTCAGLAETLEREHLDRHTLILAGPAVTALRSGTVTPKSKLYDPAFSHGYRQAHSQPDSPTGSDDA